MEKQHVEALRKHRVELVRDVHSVEEILDHLFGEGIISDNQQCLILAGTTPAQKVRLLLDTLVRCGPKAFTSFCSALKATKQFHLLELLETSQPTEESAEYRPPPDKQPASTGIMQADEAHGTSIVQQNYSGPRKPPSQYVISPYPVCSRPLGYILIVNIVEFAPACRLKPRLGSRKDAEGLVRLFRDIGYSVEVLENPDTPTLLDSLEAYAAKPEHASVDAGGMVLMSHGLRDHIYTSEGHLVSVEKLLSYFTNKALPGLAGKPKLLILQACRGRAQDFGTSNTDYVVRRDTFKPADAPVSNSSWGSLPYMSDCVIAYSTLPGFVSWRSEDEGSWFIQVLLDVFRRLGNKLHVIDLLAEVNRIIVEQSQDQVCKQISQPATNLRRPFFLCTRDAS
ncbi:unnamed protein product [Dibothriocephalus latus]|uniref:Caspase-2 n=1 Tax=Dibothriocephalus latus TaxID=60516 RepID=A0A3P7PB53_DIBLA|nr:unnamed protein product [Dibothriocephalus latus]